MFATKGCYSPSRRRRSAPECKDRTLGTPLAEIAPAPGRRKRVFVRAVEMRWRLAAASFVGPKVEAENEVWHDLRRNPEGRGQFFPFRPRSSLADTRYASLPAPLTEKYWLPALTLGKVNSRLYGRAHTARGPEDSSATVAPQPPKLRTGRFKVL